MSYQTICCVGDSVANGYWCDRGLGWFGRLQEKIAQAYPLQFGFNNLAQSGDRSWDVYHRICSEAQTRRPDILIIAVGINDIIRWSSPDGPTDISPASRGEAWQKILDAAEKTASRILVVGMLPNVEARYPCTGWDDVTPMWHKTSETRAYDADIAAWCAARHIPHLALFPHFEGQALETLFEDAGHPNGAGHALICAAVFDRLSALGWLGAP